HFAQVADDADLKNIRRQVWGAGKGFHRLIDDARFGVEGLRQFVESFGLKDDQTRCEFQRHSRSFTFWKIAVKVRAGQRDNQRFVRALTMKTVDGIVAAARVQCDKQVV